VTSNLTQLLDRMAEMEADLVRRDDARRFFHATYRRTTMAVAEEIGRGGFEDDDWLERWDVRFADLYLEAFDAYEATGRAPGPWQVAFDRAVERAAPPLRLVLLGMNAHINYDLPQALVAVISPEEFDDPEVLARRGRDHRHIDEVLASRVRAEDKELARSEPPGSRTWVDRLLVPLNTLGTKRFLRESRRKVWHNTRLLDGARRRGPDVYAARLAELGELSAERVVDLGLPGQVVLRLARRGFGVELAA
jgi:hypothetical protein